jgi:hypothetical protein
MATKSTKPYITLTELRLDGEDTPVGETVELTDRQAEQLLSLGAVEPAETAAAVTAKAKK